MPRKKPEDVKEERRQRGLNELLTRRLNPYFRKELNAALSKFKRSIEGKMAMYFMERIPREQGQRAPRWEDVFFMTPEGQELQQKYRVSISLTPENIPYGFSIADLPSHSLLEKGGRSVFLSRDPVNGDYLTIHIDLRRPSTDIVAEIEEILSVVKKGKRRAKPKDPLTPLQYKIIKLWQYKGMKPAQIIHELSNEKGWPGGSERSMFDYVKKAKDQYKMRNWQKPNESTKIGLRTNYRKIKNPF